MLKTLTPRERRIARRMEGRGQDGMAEALCGLKGLKFGRRYRIDSLYAIGGEGAVYLATDLKDKKAMPCVAKVPLIPLHRPFELNDADIRSRRDGIRVEGDFLGANSSAFMPKSLGVFEVRNPQLDGGRGGAFSETEPVLVMEKYPGRDLDVWLARMHRSSVPQAIMRRTLDRVAVVLLQGLVDMNERGIYYADLRPGNLRMMGRPHRRIRFLDAGSLVNMDDKSGRFPHVPAYLPADVFHSYGPSNPIMASAAIQAVMAGRTLFEVATGSVPRPGYEIDSAELEGSNVSRPVQQVIAKLCSGGFPDVKDALQSLTQRATRRVTGANDPSKVKQEATGAAAKPASTKGAESDEWADAALHNIAHDVLPASRSKPFWKKILGWLFGV